MQLLRFYGWLLRCYVVEIKFWVVAVVLLGCYVVVREFWMVSRVLPCSYSGVMGGCYGVMQLLESFGWLLWCHAVVREFWMVASVLCSC